MSNTPSLLGVIGGTALLKLPLKDVKEIPANTPFGLASSPFTLGTLPNGAPIVFVARHGLGHTIAPSQINNRANIYGLKKLGVTHVLSISAVGSLQDDVGPGLHMLVPDQLFDFTKGIRARTFFDQYLAVHVPLGDPFCQNIRAALIVAASHVCQGRIINGGTYVVIEGPQFSTRVESCFFRDHVTGAAVIGMTAMPEAGLAREAGLCYAILALPADYDAWRTGQTVTADEVKAGLAKFMDMPLDVVQVLSTMLPERSCTCAKSLEGMAVHTLQGHRPKFEGDMEFLRVLGVPEIP